MHQYVQSLPNTRVCSQRFVALPRDLYVVAACRAYTCTIFRWFESFMFNVCFGGPPGPLNPKPKFLKCHSCSSGSRLAHLRSADFNSG